MQKVVDVSLNGNGYVLEEEGYAALQRYLDAAGRELATDPDRAEILADLEQAIAEKCARHLGPHKTVVTAEEMQRALSEMGPVGGAQEVGPAGTASGESGTQGTSTPEPSTSHLQDAPRRLYRILETGIIGGLCSGVGAYLGVDANVVRALFAILAIVTHGAWILVYLVLLFVIPSAGTAEERAAARGLPFSAQALVDEAKRQYARLKGLGGSRGRARRRWRNHWRRAWRTAPAGAPPGAAPVAPASYGEQVAAGVVVPALAILSAALTVAFWVAAAMIVQTGSIAGWAPGTPIWGTLVALVVAVLILGGPMRQARHALHRDAWGRGTLLAAWDGVLRLGFVVLFGWLAWQHSPELRAAVNDLPGVVERVRGSLPHRAAP